MVDISIRVHEGSTIVRISHGNIFNLRKGEIKKGHGHPVRLPRC